MIIDKEKLDLVRASQRKKISELNVSKSTIKRINNGLELMPCTVGKIAQSLNCEVTDLLKGGDA